MKLIEDYLFYIQEQGVTTIDTQAPTKSVEKSPVDQEKIKRFRNLKKELKVKRKGCKDQEEPAKTNCFQGLVGLKSELDRLSKDISPTAHAIGVAVGKGVKTTKDFVQKHSTLAKYAAGAAAISLSVAAAVKVYNRFFSNAAKACQDAPNKTECIKDYKIQALQRAKTEIAKGKGKCAQTKSPKKCVERMNKQVANYDKKILSLKR